MKRTMKIVLYMIIGIILTASLMLTGCQSEELTAEEIQAKTIDAMGKVNSYKMDYDMALEVEATEGDNTMQVTMDGSGTGIMDIRDEKMQMTMDMEMEVPGTGTSQMSMSMSMEMYLYEGWQYMKMEIPLAGEQWMKMESPSYYAQDQMAQLTTLMTSSIESSLQGTEKVDGIECYVLDITPDFEELWEWVMSQQGTDLAEGLDFSGLDLSDIVENLSFKSWISKSDFQIIKAEAEMSMEIDAETFGGSANGAEGATIMMTMTMIFSDYNESVNIELPEEALNAEETDSFSY